MRFWLTALLLGLLTLAVYWPGLHGGFLFDDYGSLPALGAFGPIEHWETFWRYITSGGGDPTGRPLALLSFLIDAHNWPADPLPFKRTNLVLHLVNSVLLMILLRLLGHIAFSDTSSKRIDLAASLAAAFWMLQPLLVSTTLYIVQRETMLAAGFTLLGLLTWLHGRNLLTQGRSYSSVMWMVLGLVVCTSLALLSKANGALLPLFALVIEYAFLRTYASPFPKETGTTYRLTMLILAWFPTALIVAYLIYQGWSGITVGITSVRPWTLGERLLTEPRMLMRYLDLLWLPRPFTAGLFNDQIHASNSLWSPATTLPSLLLVIMLIAGAWQWRRLSPAIAMAILFYFAGHLLESTTIPLELYFEHRNYLPAMMMYWPLALWLSRIAVIASPKKRLVIPDSSPPDGVPSVVFRFVRPAIAVLVLAGLALMTYANTKVWGNTHDQALLWATLNPDSPRAQTNAALVDMNLGAPELAAQRLQKALINAPNEAQLALNLLTAQCELGHATPTTLDAARTALSVTRDPGPLLLSWFDTQLAQMRQAPCPQLNLQTLDELLNAALANPRLMAIYGRRQDLFHLQGQIALAKGDGDKALMHFNQALDQQIDAQTALNQAALLGAAGFPTQGLAHLEHYGIEQNFAHKAAFGMPRVHAWVLQRQQYWPEELTNLRATLGKDAANQTPHSQ